MSHICLMHQAEKTNDKQRTKRIIILKKKKTKDQNKHLDLSPPAPQHNTPQNKMALKHNSASEGAEK